MISIKSHWRRQALSKLFHFMSIKNFNSDLVTKVLEMIGKHLKVENMVIFLECNLNFVITDWVEKYKFNDFITFPWTLLKCHSLNAFLSKYSSHIVPVLLLNCKLDIFNQIATQMNVTPGKLIKDCFPSVIGGTLLMLQERTYKQRGYMVLDTIRQSIGSEDLKEMISQNLPEIVISIISKQNDQEQMNSLYNSSHSVLLNPEPINFNTETVLGALKYLQDSSPNPEMPLMDFLSRELPGHVQKILVELYTNVQCSPTPESRLSWLQHYMTIIEIITGNINPDEVKSADFIISFILQTLLHLVSKESALPVLTFFNQLITNVLPSCGSQVNKLLPVIVATLVPIAQQQTVLGKRAVLIMNNLFLNYSDILPGISLVDPLPKDPVFNDMSLKYKELRYKTLNDHLLQNEIKHFVEADIPNHLCSYRIEGLRSLRIQLSEKKEELAKLYEDLKTMKGFSEDCERSVLHRAICLLIKLISNENPAVRMEAARCLGELGPGNLTTLVLKPDLKHTSSSDLLELLCFATSQLLFYIFDVDANTVQEASTALYSIFSSFQGRSVYNKLSDANKMILYPFIHSLKKSKTKVQSGSPTEIEIRSVAENFCTNWPCSHQQWITHLVCSMLDVCQLQYLVPICKIKVSFAQSLFPYIISILLEISDLSKYIIIEEVNKFFSISAKEELKSSQTDNFENVYCNRASVQCMLTVVNRIRLHNTELRKPLDLNFLNIAKAAQFCSAYFTSILYTHLYCYGSFNSQNDTSQYINILDLICDDHEERGQTVQNLLKEAYSKINEPDAIDCCTISNMFDLEQRLQHYQYEKNWNRIIETSDMLVSVAPEQNGLVSVLRDSFHRSGLHYSASSIGDLSCREEDYESSWRLGQWDVAERKGTIDDSFNCLLYIALRAHQNQDKLKALAIVDTARQQVINVLKNASLEATNNIYSTLAQLLALQEIEDFANLEITETLNKWKNQEKIGWSEFIHIEPIIAQRIVLLKNRTALQDVSNNNLSLVFICAAEIARKEKAFTIAERWLLEAISLPNLSTLNSLTIQLHEAFVLWDIGEKSKARKLLRTLLQKLRDYQENPTICELYSTALRTYGSWMASEKSETAHVIIENYFKPAIKIAGRNDKENTLAAIASLAQFADSEYKMLLKYVQSSHYKRKVEGITRLKEDAIQLQDQLQPNCSTDFKRSFLIHRQQSEIDRKEVEKTQKELGSYLLLAMKFFLKGLDLGNYDDLKIFRVVSLWLDNSENIELNRILGHLLQRIPTYKYLPVIPQLIARLSDSGDVFSRLLQSLIESCANDHPHHVLPHLLALSNSFLDSAYTVPPSKTKTSKNEPRINAAQQLIASLESSTNGMLLKDMQLVSEAYISLANSTKPGKSAREIDHNISKTQPITKLKNLEHVLCPIVTPPINKLGNYEDIIGIYKHEESFQMVGGVNEPKKLFCICTDGIKRPMLIKGNDDLRQDAVMQQVFTIMNSLLSKNKETQRRKLIMRTYKVVPLSQRSGVIEWCTNTIPFSVYLLGSGKQKQGAHAKYRPNDWSHIECRKKLVDARRSQDDNRDVYDEICKHFKPVFRYFFLEKFHSSGIWFERHLAYTHSVATSSMIGYILGLGDRHPMNILIDENSAEIIHIDFGIAFEQGLVLPTPETVPFRLSRDIEDGMGISGCEGVFRRSCEKTMMVLRECQDTILTILSVLLYDPLYLWTITPEKAQQKQLDKSDITRSNTLDCATVEVNKLAERALVRLGHKLQGIEDGSTSSIEGQVARLIQEAKNPNNLCQLFHGWQAYV
uniref:Serine/threonine-protein kinase ATM n=4 Tax=Clastoptera arizonana TaxID=38151 RepID=A0A1B6BXN6_9HEMI